MLHLSENELDRLVSEERRRGTGPLTDWDSLSARLRAEGLIRKPIAVRRFYQRPMFQAAAALLLVAGGLVAGRVSAGAPLLPQKSEVAVTPAPASSNTGRNNTGSAPITFASTEEAWETLNRAGEEYQRATAYLAALHGGQLVVSDSSSMFRTRLAALDDVMSTTRQALNEAPHDPVLNQYYLATVGAREATLRQLGTTLPAGVRLERF